MTSDADLLALGRGGALWLYTGGAFIWPGVRIGHKTRVPIPVTDGSSGGYKEVEMETRSLRPLVLELSGFLTEAECAFIRKCGPTLHTPRASVRRRPFAARSSTHAAHASRPPLVHAAREATYTPSPLHHATSRCATRPPHLAAPNLVQRHPRAHSRAHRPNARARSISTRITGAPITHAAHPRAPTTGWQLRVHSHGAVGPRNDGLIRCASAPTAGRLIHCHLLAA